MINECRIVHAFSKGTKGVLSLLGTCNANKGLNNSDWRHVSENIKIALTLLHLSGLRHCHKLLAVANHCHGLPK